MNLESTGGSTTTESTERDDFTKAEARLDEIKKMSLDELSDDEAEAILAERKALRAQKTEMVGDAQDEANAENQKIDDLEKQKAEAERVAAEVAAEAQQAEEKARALAERQQKDAEKIAALRAEIQGDTLEQKEKRVVNLDEAKNISGLIIKSFDERSGGSRRLDTKDFDTEGLTEGTFARNGNNIIFRQGEKVLYLVENEQSGVYDTLMKNGFKQVEGVGVPSLSDPELYFAGSGDSTFRDIQETARKNRGQ